MKAFKKVTVWCKEHSIELIFGGLGMGVAIVAYHYGYDTGEVKGKIEASDHYRELIPEMIDKCGYLGFDATMRAIENTAPETYHAICEAFSENKVNVCDLYNNHPYIEQLEESFSGDVVEFGKRVMSKEV